VHHVLQGGAVGEVVDSRQLIVVVWLSVADAQRVKVEQTAQISACDTPSQANCRIPGKVKVIGKVADSQTGNLPVRILVENGSGSAESFLKVAANRLRDNKTSCPTP